MSWHLLEESAAKSLSNRTAEKEIVFPHSISAPPKAHLSVLTRVLASRDPHPIANMRYKINSSCLSIYKASLGNPEHGNLADGVRSPLLPPHWTPRLMMTCCGSATSGLFHFWRWRNARNEKAQINQQPKAISLPLGPGKDEKLSFFLGNVKIMPEKYVLLNLSCLWPHKVPLRFWWESYQWLAEGLFNAISQLQIFIPKLFTQVDWTNCIKHTKTPKTFEK